MEEAAKKQKEAQEKSNKKISKPNKIAKPAIRK
jgi:hypothetical protein